MVEIVPFKPEHLAALRLQGAQAASQPQLTRGHGEDLASLPGAAYTALADGRPIACAGIIRVWEGRGYAWSYLSEEALSRFKDVHRAVLKALRACRLPRVEMAVNPQHPAAKRWAWHLGFDFECLARKWAPDGRDMEIWVRIS